MKICSTERNDLVLNGISLVNREKGAERVCYQYSSK